MVIQTHPKYGYGKEGLWLIVKNDTSLKRNSVMEGRKQKAPYSRKTKSETYCKLLLHCGADDLNYWQRFFWCFIKIFHQTNSQHFYLKQLHPIFSQLCWTTFHLEQGKNSILNGLDTTSGTPIFWDKCILLSVWQLSPYLYYFLFEHIRYLFCPTSMQISSLVLFNAIMCLESLFFFRYFFFSPVYHYVNKVKWQIYGTKGIKSGQEKE